MMNQLNERLGQFIAARAIDRMHSPGVGETLRITQQELAYLVGLSRQRVNEALNVLQARGSIRIEYGGVRVLKLEALYAAAEDLDAAES